MTINGLRQRFVILKNERKVPGSSQPDYLLMSGDEPEPDQYAQRQQAQGDLVIPPEPPKTRETGCEPTDDDIPFVLLLAPLVALLLAASRVIS